MKKHTTSKKTKTQRASSSTPPTPPMLGVADEAAINQCLQQQLYFTEADGSGFRVMKDLYRPGRWVSGIFLDYDVYYRGDLPSYEAAVADGKCRLRRLKAQTRR